MLVGMLTASLVACQGTKTEDTSSSETPAATTSEQEGEHIIAEESILQWGTVSAVDQATHQIGLELKQDSNSDPSMKILLNTTEDTPVIDANSGEKLSMDALKEGNEIYAWVDPAFAMSEPPQTNANILIANAGEGTVPNYQTIESVEKQDDGYVITTLDGTKWKFEKGVSLKTYPSYEDADIETLKKGNKCLFWPKQIPVENGDELLMYPTQILIMK